MPYLANITIYPIKSLDGQSVPQARLLASGALQHDRQFALADADGNFVNGKRTPLVHQLRSQFDIEGRTLQLSTAGEEDSFHVDDERSRLEAWLSRYFGLDVHWLEQTTTGFPDDLEAPGPTVVGSSTLETVASWFEEIDATRTRRRFRANLEIGGAEPFFEDRLFGMPGEKVLFQIGDVRIAGVNPCQRCIVPSRDPWSGKVLHGFSKQFREKREETLPPWAERRRFDHFYRFAVNTTIDPSEYGKSLHIGDLVSIL